MAGSAKIAAVRLRNVLDAVTTLSSDLSLDGLLERILREAGGLVDAERGYFDVLDRRSDRRIGTYAAYGIDDIHADGPPGRQVLVDLLEKGEPRSGRGSGGGRKDRMSFIGVPIRIHDFLFGNVYLFDKRSGHGFSREDEEDANALASAAGVVIENARLYEEGERQRMWLEAAAEITTSLLSPITRDSALQLVTDRAREVSSADFVALLMPQRDQMLIVEAVSGIPAEGVLGEVIDSRRSLAGDAVRTGETVVVPDTDFEPRYEPKKTPQWPDLGSLMVLPLNSGDDVGALIVGWLKGHQTDRWELDPAVPQQFADQAALVLQVVRAQADQARLAVFEDRDRIGRDLHDLVIQRLFGIGLMLDNTTKLISRRWQSNVCRWPSTTSTRRSRTSVARSSRSAPRRRRPICAPSWSRCCRTPRSCSASSPSCG
ncbi:GAF domain-containing protein [Aeromicrobium sp. UC242_57]|uniref:GAF domain-containing protein n=1 Tax=Aeromicrobium sp. UC242_57 TaxID=3374624 RepID=UPI00378C4C75